MLRVRSRIWFSSRLCAIPHEPWLERIWQLRGNLTACDAAYVALAAAWVPLCSRATRARAARLLQASPSR
jgi:predicted nucleic acid-binding protein